MDNRFDSKGGPGDLRIFSPDSVELLTEEQKKERSLRLYRAARDFDRDGRCREALSLYKESLSICREIGDRAGEGAALNRIGRMYHARCSYVDALICLEESLIICREIGDRAGQGDILNHIGRICQERCNYAEALACLEESLVICREIGDRYGEGGTLNHIGRIHQERCDYADALTCLEESLIICREVGNRAGEGAALADIGRICRVRCNYADAMPLFKRSLSIFREIGDKAEEAVVSWDIGCMYDEQGDKGRAEQYIRRAFRLAEAVSHPSVEKYRRTLARIRAGRQNSLPEAGHGDLLSTSCPPGTLPIDSFLGGGVTRTKGGTP